MTDRRLLAANDRVAHDSLSGQIEAATFVSGETKRCILPQVDLCRTAGGARDKQLLLGQPFRVLDVHDGWAGSGLTNVDGYVGYLPESAIGNTDAPNHRVKALLAHVYSEPDFKSPEIGLLSFFSEVTAEPETERFLALAGGGYIATPHLAPLSWRADDMVGVAELFLGTPYLWGGNTATGIDCSGLVQLAAYAHGIAAPRDSDLQQAELGQELPEDAPLRRGDLLFWKGHVAWVVDEGTILHANAHHMAWSVSQCRRPSPVSRRRAMAL